MELETTVQVLHKAAYAPFCANTLKKGMNPSVLIPSNK